MTSLVLGAVGAVIGGYLGGPAGASLGWSIGSAAGAALDPGKGTEGPRVSDLKLQQSSYGGMIPIVYGTVRIAGNVIWQTDLVEHSHEEGGKGGPVNTTFTYSASFAILLCEGPIAAVPRIWADNRLIYDENQAPVAVALLDPHQFAPDDWNYHVRHPETWPLVEISEFVNQQRQAYSAGGINYDADWSDAGYAGYFIDINAPSETPEIPELPFTLYYGDEEQGADPTIEAALGVGNVPGYRGRAYIVFTDLELSDYGNRIPNFTFEVAQHKSGDIPVRVSTYTRLTGHTNYGGIQRNANGTTTNVLLNWSPSDNPTDRITEVRQIDGTLVSTMTESVVTWNGLGVFSASQCKNNVAISEITAQSFGGGDFGAWYHWTTLGAHPIDGGGNSAVVSKVIIYYNDNVYAIGEGDTAAFIACYPSPNNVTNATPSQTYTLPVGVSSSNWVACVSDDGYIYVANASGHMLKLDPELNLVRDWGTSGPLDITYSFVVYQGKICHLHQALGGEHYARVETINNDNTFTVINEIPVTEVGDLISLGEGLISVADGIISLVQPTGPILLSEVVADISERCGLMAYDVDELDDLVDGYVVAHQTTGRSMLEPLQSVYYWDPVESDDIVKCVKRNKSTLIIIPEDDLAAHTEGEDLPALLPSVRAQDVDLPGIVNTVYLAIDTDYQNGTQISRRMVTNSLETVTLELPIVLSDAKGKQVADAILFNTHLERTSYSFSTTRKYAKYEPCDIIETHGKKLRLTKKVEAGGIIKWEATGVLGAVFEQDAPTMTGTGAAAPSAGFIPPTIPTPLRTSLQLLDIPLLPGAADTFGAYAVMGGATTGSWPGATLYKSLDGGLTYSSIATDITPDTWGSTVGALGDFLGGNVFDEISVLPVVMLSGELSSATELSVLNGGNAAVIGNEIVQFKNAILTAERTYELSGLLRGRLGTEWAMSTHATSERFVLLAAGLTFISGSLSEVNISRKYKAVTLGQTLASTTAVDFTNTGVVLKPYSPVQLGGGSNDVGDTTLNWVRRTRIDGGWVDGSDVPLGEASERYVIQIWDSTYSQVARIDSTLTAQTFIYTSAMQVADFGAQQQTVFFSVNQIGALLGRPARGFATGLGSTNDLPITPLAPYGYVAPPVVGVVNMTLAWPGGTDYTSGFTVGSAYVVEFTTDVTTPGGYIVMAEYVDPPMYRHGVISTDAAGLSILAQGYGNTVSIFFGPGAGNANLAPSTTYYFVVRCEMPDGSPSGTIGASANAVVQLHGV